MTILYRHFKSDLKKQSGKRHGILRIQPVLEEIERNLTSPIDSKDSGGIATCHAATFSLLFKTAMGFNFIDYLVCRRISLVSEKLSTTDKGITEIAFECGFHNLSYFNLAFRKITGETPSDFRKRQN